MSGHKKQKAAQARLIVALTTLKIKGNDPVLVSAYETRIRQYGIKRTTKFRELLLINARHSVSFRKDRL